MEFDLDSFRITLPGHVEKPQPLSPEQEKEFDLVQSRMRAELQKSRVRPDTIRRRLAQQNADGTFRDIDYSNRNNSSWQVARHLQYALEFALAWSTAGHEFHHDEALGRALRNAVNWWGENSFAPDKLNDETKALHKELIGQLVARDKNHPSFVMLSVANEAATHEQAAGEYFKDVISYARTVCDLPVTIVEFTKFEDGSKVADLVDVICINRYYGWYTDHGCLDVIGKQIKEEIDGKVQREIEKKDAE